MDAILHPFRNEVEVEDVTPPHVEPSTFHDAIDMFGLYTDSQEKEPPVAAQTNNIESTSSQPNDTGGSETTPTTFFSEQRCRESIRVQEGRKGFQVLIFCEIINF